MAKPPERIEDVLPMAALVVEATVREVTSTGNPIPKSDEKISDKGTQYAEQTLLLDVARVLRGSADKSVSVKKPIAPYLVKAGVTGAWLVDKDGVVLGRYGPDTWPLAKVEAALRPGGGGSSDPPR